MVGWRVVCVYVVYGLDVWCFVLYGCGCFVEFGCFVIMIGLLAGLPVGIVFGGVVWVVFVVSLLDV